MAKGECCMNQRYSLASMTSLDTSGPINSPPWSDTRQFPLHSENSINGCYKRHPFNYSTLILCRNPMAPMASDAENPTTEPQAEASHLELIDSSYEVNRAQGPDRRSAGAENQDFQLRTRRRRVPATATTHISATAHFFANFRVLSKFHSKTHHG